MSSPSDPQPLEHQGRSQSSTQEIPVVQPAGATAAGQHVVAAPLPPHPGAVAPVPMDPVQPTGPVDFVPGLPGTPPVPPAAAPPLLPGHDEAATAATEGVVWPDTLEAGDDSGRTRKVRRLAAPRDRAALLGVGLAVLALVLLELGLALDFGRESYWSAVPLWSAFATLCAVLGVVALGAGVPSGSRLRSGAVWRIAVAGLVGLAVFWVLVVLPVVASDRGFLLTAALGALGAAVWIGPGRRA